MSASDELAQSDEQFVQDPSDAASIAARTLRLDLHTSMPGIIKSFDPSDGTVKVQPAIMRNFAGIGPTPLPPFEKVPVLFPGGGNFVRTDPIADGDECLLLIAERAIDFWWKNGGVQDASEVRFHDYSDAIALVGLNSLPRKLAPGASTTASEWRTRDGATRVRLEAGKIWIGTGTVEKASNGETTNQWLSDLADQLLALTVNTAVGPSSPPINSGAFTALKARLSQLLSTTVVIQK